MQLEERVSFSCYTDRRFGSGEEELNHVALQQQKPPSSQGVAPASIVEYVISTAGGANKTIPPRIRRATMQSMQRLLPRMALAKQASTVMHPMLRLLDGEHDELRRDAVGTPLPLLLSLMLPSEPWTNQLTPLPPPLRIFLTKNPLYT